MLTEVAIRPRAIESFEPLVGRALLEEIRSAALRLRSRLRGRPLWTLNTTAAGGGVAEMLRPLLGYCRGLGIDVRWLIVQGRPDFFRITKRLHNALHGTPGDGSPLGGKESAAYEEVLEANASDLLGRVRRGDIVLLHDPQTAGLIPPLERAGAMAIWRCHIGGDLGSEEVRRGWRFLEPWLEPARAFIFSRRDYVPPFCAPGLTEIIHPSIDPFSPKNQDLEDHAVRSILAAASLVAGAGGGSKSAYRRGDGSTAIVSRRAEVVREGNPPEWERPLVVQVSRWDRLKDPAGVMAGFTKVCSNGNGSMPHLVLAGPSVKEVADDPEGAEVYRAAVEQWRSLPLQWRRRIHLATVPMDDLDENAAIINALQRHAAVVVQKSLQEGFGLTVTEAMWKARPVVASAVGGIREQIDDGRHGLLVEDPQDLDAFSALVSRALDDPSLCRSLSEGARERVRERFLGMHSLASYARLFERLLA